MRRIEHEAPPESPPWWQLDSRPEPSVFAGEEESSIWQQLISKAPVTLILVGVNVLVFLLFNMNLIGLGEFHMRNFALVPATITGVTELPQVAGSYFTLLSHMFVHAGWAHILINMFVLFQFGAFVEMRMGSGPFTLMYLVGGLAAGLLQIAVTPASAVPAVGASGAIAGVLGGFIYLYPNAKLLLFFIFPMSAQKLGNFFVYFSLFCIASPLFLGGVGVLEFWAHGAHLGGYLFGYFFFVILGLLRPDIREPLSPEEAFREY